MDDELQSPTPEKGDNKDSTTSTPGEKQKAQQDKKLSFRDWAELCFAAVVIPWIWSEMIGVHEASKLSLMALALLLGYVGACHFLHTLTNLIVLPVILWIVFSVSTFLFVWTNSRPAPQRPNFGVFIDGLDIAKFGEVLSVNLPKVDIDIQNRDSKTVEDVWVNFATDAKTTDLDAPLWTLQPGFVYETNGILVKDGRINVWKAGPLASIGGGGIVSMPPIFITSNVLIGQTWHMQIGVRGTGVPQEKYATSIIFTNHSPQSPHGVKSPMFSN